MGIFFLNDEKFIYEYNKFNLNNFEFQNGEILEDVTVEYIVKGTPKYDDEGNIINAVIFCPNYDRNCFAINDYPHLTDSGMPFDLNNFFSISITSLGVPDSCCPSTTGLKYNFPAYGFLDKVNYKKQFIKEKLNIEKVHGIVGKGMGGYEVYTWACEYPDDMDFMIVANSSFKTNGYRYVIAKGIESIIDSSNDFYSDIYDQSLTKTMISINKILYSQYFSKRIFQQLSNDEIDVLMDEYVEDGLFIDIYDFKLQNDAILYYDVEDKLSNIKAKSLILSPFDDLYFTPEFDTVPLKNLIDDCEMVVLSTNEEKSRQIYHKELISALNSFLKKI